jgi:hypothetical protein
MPTLPELTVEAFAPPYPLHWLQIVRYLVLLGTFIIMILPREQSSTTITMLLGALALVTVGDVYGNKYIRSAFTVYMLRIMMIVIPVLMAGTSPDEQGRAAGIFLAILSVPGLLIMLLVPWFDPLLEVRP